MVGAPERTEPSAVDWQHPLWLGVKRALLALPGYFSTETHITGLRATDIFTLNATLGAAIEDQVVDTLNSMRAVWDPDGRHPLFYFVRQPQTFPDVLLRSRSEGGPEVALGIELKGWYLLAKEGEPSFRYQVTASACSEWDLLAVVPWYLSNVISGTPRVLAPYLESAKYAALYRNYHWQHVRAAQESTEIRIAPDASPYPRKSDQIADRPLADRGGNFGRLARSGIMESYVADVNDHPIAGIAARYWRQFFKTFQEHEDPSRIAAMLARIAQRGSGNDELMERAHRIVIEVAEMLEHSQHT